MAIGSIRITVKNVTGTDVYGKASLAPQTTELCDVVSLSHEVIDSSARRGLSATGAHAEDYVAAFHILVASNTKICMGAKIRIRATDLRVTYIQPKFDVSGSLDHYEVKGDIWV